MLTNKAQSRFVADDILNLISLLFGKLRHFLTHQEVKRTDRSEQTV